jgi:predicted RNA-binding protein YlqC (UPF0109 family)
VTSIVPEMSVPELVAAVARALVDRPSDVSINETSNEFGKTLYLKVHRSDVGLVIGKQGRTARSLRTILGAISVKLKYRYSLEIVDGFVADRDLEEK